MSDGDAERVVKNRLVEDKAMFAEQRDKLGQDRAELVSEIANVALVALVFPPLRPIVDHLVPPAARVLQITEEELMAQMQAYLRIRAITQQQVTEGKITH